MSRPDPLVREDLSQDPIVLRHSSDLYAQMFEDSPVAKYVCDLAGTILEVNSAMCELLGLSPAEVIGHTVSSFSVGQTLHEAQLEPFLSGAQRRFSCRRRYRTSDGKVRLTRVTLGAMRDGEGHASAILGEVEDITPEANALNDSVRYRRRIELALKTCDMVVFDLDCPSGVLTLEFGGGLQELDPPTVMPYASFIDSVHFDDRHRLPLVDDEDGVLAGDEVDFDFRIRMGPEWRWFHSRGLIVRDEDSAKPISVTGVAADITEQKRVTAKLAAQRDRLQLALETAGMMAWELKLRPDPPELHVIHQDLLGITSGVDLNDTSELLRSHIHPDDQNLVLDTFTVAIADGVDLVDLEHRWLDDESKSRWVHTRANVERDAKGRVVRIVGTTADVSSCRSAVAERLAAERIMWRTLEASHDAFIGLDRHCRIVDWNPSAEGMFGFSREDVLGMPLPHELDVEAGISLTEVISGPELSSDGACLRVELEMRSRNGRAFPVEASVVRIDSGSGKLLRVFLRDLSGRRAYEEELVRHAFVDPLTNLPNRALLVDRMNVALERAVHTGGQVAVLFADLDRFKIVNESLGHDAGDRLLVLLAERLKKTMRPADTVARFGADEFVVVCEGLIAELESGVVADLVASVLEQPFDLGGHEVYVSASVGIAVAAGPEATAEALIRDAHSAMCRAKERGGSRAEIFDVASRRRSVIHLETESQLRRALEREELRVYYQPVVDLTGKVEKVEALVRWAHPSGRTASPAEFVPLAEETGMIEAIGEYVLRVACGQVATWRREHPSLDSLELAVNVSGVQLRNGRIVERIQNLLELSGLPPEALILEITESTLMDDATGVTARLSELREMGLRLAIDDFGTGYSSFLYLRRYPVDLLKIDRSFVAGSVKNPQDAAIVDAVVKLGHALGLQTVAEGVETEEQLRLLRALDCDLGQGYLWGRPSPGRELAKKLLAASTPSASVIVRS